MDMLSTENVSSDVFHGCFVVTCTLFGFIGLIWLREQILHAGGPDWLERDNVQLPPVDNPPQREGQDNQQPQEPAANQPNAQNNNNVPPYFGLAENNPILLERLPNMQGLPAKLSTLSNVLILL